jgi:protocatechuate 3,4-dioxygenase beta subunit
VPEDPQTGAGEAGGGDAAARAAGALAVVVRDSDGEPIAGATVRAQNVAGGGSAGAATGREGIAELQLPEGNYLVLVEPPQPAPPLRGLAPVTVSSGERTEVRCTVPMLESEIAGRVLDAGGRPVEGIEVEARPMTFPGSGFAFDVPPRVSPSGATGEFRITGLAPVEHVLTTRETSTHLSARNTAVAGSSGLVDLVLTDRRALLVLGTVSDRKGKPVKGAVVSVAALSGSTTTDEKGRFRLEIHYERGSLIVRASKDGGAQVQLIVSPEEIADRGEVEVALQLDVPGEMATLSGTVSSEVDGSPLATQVVRLHSPSLNLTYQGGTGADGLYTIGRIMPADDYRIWVNPPRGYRDFLQERAAIAEGENRLDITLTPMPTARLRGVLLDAEGHPLPRLTLWIRNAAASANSLSVTGDARGSFDAGEVPAGEVFFETRAEPRVTVSGLKLAEEEERQVELIIGLGKGSLTGRVSSARGGPLGGAQVSLSWLAESGGLQSRVFRQARTDADGAFTMTGLARGRSILTVRVAGYRDWTEERNLTGGKDDLPNIALSPLSGR